MTEHMSFTKITQYSVNYGSLIFPIIKSFW
jgi:hypothetical protein